MRANDLEARVLGAVDRLRGGQNVENDFIECKRDWPGENKARQLAGSLNRASGDPVIYIIGIDEQGDVHETSDTDVLDWWSQIVPAFDQTPPEMSRHMDVVLGSNGESVVAVAISSDRAPYVVKTGSARPSLEIPMREGTGTRTARRDELLRMMIPTVKVPPTVVLSADVRAEYNGYGGKPKKLTVAGTVRVFFEHSAAHLVTVPVYGMRGTITFGDHSYDLSVRPPFTPETQTQQFGVTSTPEWLLVTGPGAADVNLAVRDLPDSSRDVIAESDTCQINLELDVLDAIRPIRIQLQLLPAKKAGWKSPDRVGTWDAHHSRG